MRRLLCLLLLALALPVGAAGFLDSRPNAVLGGALNNSSDFLPVREAFQLSVVEANAQHVRLRFVAADGYYLYRHRFQFHANPADLQLGAAQLPQGENKHDEYFGDVEVYHSIVDVDLPRPANDPRPFDLAVTYQGCADKGLCYPPQTQHFSIEASGATPSTNGQAPATVAGQSTGWRDLLLFFLAGIGLTFTPCVLPMLPILSGVVLRGKVGGWRGLSLSLAYVLPMALCFAALGALMGLFGAQMNLQARLQSPEVLIPFALFFVVFALAMFGLFELKLPQAVSSRLDRLAGNAKGGSLWGAAVLGVVSSLLVSPCVSAPLAGALLYISASGDAWGGALKLLALGLGMGAPLLLVATGGAALLPKSGPWLVTVKNAIGVLLLALAVGLLSRVLPGPVTLMLLGIIGVGIGVFLGALEFTPKTPRQRLTQLLGLLALFYGLACWYGAWSGHSDPLKPLAGSQAVQISSSKDVDPEGWQTITSDSQLQTVFAQAKAANQPLLLDWYADWCTSCKVIEHDVLPDPQVRALLKGYRLVKLDLTEINAEQRALLDRYKLFGPPALMIFAGNGSEVVDSRVIGEINATDFASKLTGANRQQGL